MSSDPDEIRADIERTRYELSRDVDTLGERVTPGGMARYQTDKMKGGLSRLRDKVMGSAQSTTSSAKSTMSDLGDRAQGAMGSAGEAVGQAPRTVLDKTEGNPLAAGLVAFGLGMVVASMIPASEKETQAAQAVKDAAGPLLDEAKDMAGAVASELREPAQEEMRGLQDSVKQAGADLAGQGRSAAQDVSQHGKEAASDVRDSSGESR